MKSEDTNPFELEIKNNSSSNLYVKFYPISMVFNGRINNDIIGNYTLKAIYPIGPPQLGNQQWWYNYNNGAGVLRYSNGTDELFTTYVLTSNSSIFLNHDASFTGNQTASFGYGIYKVVMSNTPEFYDEDSILIDYDWRTGHGDNEIHYYSDSIFFDLQYYGHIRINYNSEDNYFIKPWKKWGLTRDYGNAKYDTAQNNNYVEMPLDSRKDCNVLSGIQQNQIFNDSRSGNLPLNMTVYKDVYTRDTLVDTNTNIVIMKKVYLKINSWNTFNMITPTLPANGSTNLIVQDSAYLILGSHSKIIIGRQNKLTLGNKGQITMFAYSEIIFEPGSIFCNLGGKIKGSGGIIFRSGYHYYNCLVFAESVFEDSTKLVLEDSSDLEIPDDFTLT